MPDYHKRIPLTSDRSLLHQRLRQLILMRETGPKSAAWHRARMQLIWQLHDALAATDEEQKMEDEGRNTSTADERR